MSKAMSVNFTKPCPFCGAIPRIYSFDHGDGVPAWNIECRNCALDMGHFESIDELMEHWNRRFIDSEEYDKACGEIATRMIQRTHELEQTFLEEGIDALKRIGGKA